MSPAVELWQIECLLLFTGTTNSRRSYSVHTAAHEVTKDETKVRESDDCVVYTVGVSFMHFAALIGFKFIRYLM